VTPSPRAAGTSQPASLPAPAAATPSHEAGIAAPPPSLVHESGECDRAYGFGGVCSRIEVGEWDSIPFTPPVICAESGRTCQLQIEIDAPTSGGPWPLVVILPGGPGSPDEEIDYISPLAVSLAGQGAVVIVSEWRQSAEFGGGYPTSFADVGCAIGAARRIGPDYGANPDRVTLVGHSLGGWSGAIVALTPSPFTPAPGSCGPTAGSLRPDAFVGLAGDASEVKDQVSGADYLTAFLGGSATARPDAWRAADPFALVKRYPAGVDSIPIVLIQGGADTTVPPTVARSFQAALVAAGYDSRLVEVPAADHLTIMGATEAIDATMTLATAP